MRRTRNAECGMRNGRAATPCRRLPAAALRVDCSEPPRLAVSHTRRLEAAGTVLGALLSEPQQAAFASGATSELAAYLTDAAAAGRRPALRTMAALATGRKRVLIGADGPGGRNRTRHE
jgi:hypothetical protein